MQKNKEPEGDILETMDLLKETYEAFNDIIEKGNFTSKAMATEMMNTVDKKLKERIAEYIEEFQALDVDDEELLKAKGEEIRTFMKKSEEIKEIIQKTEKLMDKHFPVNNKTVKSNKKRIRMRRFRSKKVRDSL